MRRTGRRQFCMHLDTSGSSLEMKVLGQFTVESRAIHSHKFTHVMHTLLIRSRKLCVRYSYARIRYAYVTHTLEYVMHTLLIRLYTQRIR